MCVLTRGGGDWKMAKFLVWCGDVLVSARDLVAWGSLLLVALMSTAVRGPNGSGSGGSIPEGAFPFVLNDCIILMFHED